MTDAWQPAAGPPGYQYAPMGYGPPGRIRPTGTCIGWYAVTLGIYSFFYNYEVHTEMKDHTGQGVGGGMALLLSLLANVAMPFVTAAEVGTLYQRRGELEPVNGWTGLWFVVPAIVGYVGIVISTVVVFILADRETATGTAGLTDAGVIFLVLIVFFVLVAVAGGLAWFVKTNGALNRYWQSVGVV